MIAETLAQPARKICALLAYIREQVIATDYLLHGQRRGASERMAHIGVAVLENARAARDLSKNLFHDLERTYRLEVTTEPFGDGHQVRRDTFLFASVQRPGASDSAHHFIQNEENSMSVANFAHALKIAGHRRDRAHR